MRHLQGRLGFLASADWAAVEEPSPERWPLVVVAVAASTVAVAEERVANLLVPVAVADQVLLTRRQPV